MRPAGGRSALPELPLLWPLLQLRSGAPSTARWAPALTSPAPSPEAHKSRSQPCLPASDCSLSRALHANASQGRESSPPATGTEAAHGPEASWENKAVAEACRVPTLGGGGRPRRPRPCLPAAVGRGSLSYSGAGLSPIAPVSSPRAARGGSHGPFPWRLAQE